MYKLLFFSVSISLLFTACGPEPTPQELARDKAMADMRAKMVARQKQQFATTTAGLTGKIDRHVPQEEPGLKQKDDPTAYVYKDKVLSLEEEKPWVEAGIDNEEYSQWAELGMQAEEVEQWKALDISYSAIEVFRKQGYTPQKAQKFMNRDFFTRPDFYSQFGTPVYDFDSICVSIVKRQSPPFAFLEEKCLPYMKESHKNEAIGHLLDEAKIKKGPLALEYLAELRRLADDNSKIQSGMEVTIEEFIEDEDSENFSFLFPLLRNEPTQAEMTFIDEQKLPLTKEERFFSFQNPKYWIARAKAEDERKVAAAKQEAFLRDKKDKEYAAAKIMALKQEQAKQRKIAQKNEALRRQKAQETCGGYINPDQLSNQQALVEGEVVFIVGEHGEKMFGYGVKGRDDGEIYFIRDPKDSAKSGVRAKVSWELKTMGRTEALSQTAESEYGYDKKSKTKFTMALFVKECKI